eukprot:gnl/TRDRNA2_/TRDRNA2_60307_c0_seq1.p1 gnl/TRDRNA2_/TRDRNA2_60307_c0~~gnl/TRDRNA2_/TRDRNA2_60307_c0_seq1.p1  ORF type:complete len:314 (+),score=77.68 gnl/TRDRNA2_/TRDRNA2_60307_c0_seq1:42-983(+)
MPTPHEDADLEVEEEDLDEEEDEDEEAVDETEELNAAEKRRRKKEKEEYEADLDAEILQKACLPVSGAPLPPSDEPPQDADEYLRRVQWERMHIPETVDVDVVEKPRRKKRTPVSGKEGGCLYGAFVPEPEIPEAARHRPEWAADATAAFRSLRKRSLDLREAAHAGAWAPAASEPSSLSYDDWRERIALPGTSPSTALLAAQDVISINRLIIVVVDAIVEACEQGDAAPSHIVPFGAGPSLSEWAFAALALVEEPLVDDVQYNMQRLRRSCQKWISANHEQQTNNGGGNPDGGAHAQATLILLIVTEVFGQR